MFNYKGKHDPASSITLNLVTPEKWLFVCLNFTLASTEFSVSFRWQCLFIVQAHVRQGNIKSLNFPCYSLK